MKRAYFLLFTRPMMTQMNRKEANTSPMKACHTTQKARNACMLAGIAAYVSANIDL